MTSCSSLTRVTRKMQIVVVRFMVYLTEGGRDLSKACRRLAQPRSALGSFRATHALHRYPVTHPLTVTLGITPAFVIYSCADQGSIVLLTHS
jgi:hypothetical protein